MKQMGQLEAAVMHRLWDWDRPASVREVVDDLQRERKIAYTTVMTVLDNLHRKGLVHRQKQGRAYVYTAVMSRRITPRACSKTSSPRPPTVAPRCSTSSSSSPQKNRSKFAPP